MLHDEAGALSLALDCFLAIYLINEKSENLLTVFVFGKAFGHQLIPTTVYGFYILAFAFFQAGSQVANVYAYCVDVIVR